VEATSKLEKYQFLRTHSSSNTTSSSSSSSLVANV
jgi:hypothetical protein